MNEEIENLLHRENLELAEVKKRATAFFIDELLLSFILLISLWESFIQTKNTLEIIELTKHLPFWISSAMLIYFGSTIFFSLFEEILRGSDNWVFYYTFQIQLSATILFNILITIGLWRTRQTYC